MNHTILLVFIGSLLLVSLAGVCFAEETPTFIAYVQGGEAAVTEGSPGDTIITVQDIIPFYYLATENRSNLVPVEGLLGYSYPLNASVIFSGTDNESASLVLLSNLSLSEGNKVLTLQVTPQKYYEGEALRSFTGENRELDTISTTGSKKTSIYIELKKNPVGNTICYGSYLECMNCCNYRQINPYPQSCDYHCKMKTVWCYQHGFMYLSLAPAKSLSNTKQKNLQKK